MESDGALETLWLDCVDSTQDYLIDKLKHHELQPPVAVVATKQTQGKGSRGSSWESFEGNLFLSFAFLKSMLPEDLKLESSSIYFAYLLKQKLCDRGSKVTIKWPNDFYLANKKIGGVITNNLNDVLVCGIGLNSRKAFGGYGILDIEVEYAELLNDYFGALEEKVEWKNIFSKYELEFNRNKHYFTKIDGQHVTLDNLILNKDGSVDYSGKRIYSLR